MGHPEVKVYETLEIVESLNLERRFGAPRILGLEKEAGSFQILLYSSTMGTLKPLYLFEFGSPHV